MMGFLWFLLIGLAAGWLAGQIMKSPRTGLTGDLIVGVIGAILGGFLFDVIGLKATGMVGSLVTATVGAVALIAGLRALNRR
ncbi:MAG: GlsB/YeaQ/YmgE family stress response membrane protein [Isosphaeraceae bacterium]